MSELKYSLEFLSSASFVRPWRPSGGSSLPYTPVRTNDFNPALGSYQLRLVIAEELVLQATSGLSPLSSSGSRSLKSVQPTLPSPVSLSLAVSQDASLRKDLMGLLNDLIQPSSGGLLEGGALAARLRRVLVARDRRALLKRARGEEILAAFAAVEGCIAAAAITDARATLAYLAHCRVSERSSPSSGPFGGLPSPAAKAPVANSWPWLEEEALSQEAEHEEGPLDAPRSDTRNVDVRGDLVGLVGHAESYTLLSIPVGDVGSVASLAEAAFTSLPCPPRDLSPREQLDLLCSALGGVGLIRATVPCGSVRAQGELERPGVVRGEATRPLPRKINGLMRPHSKSFELSMENAHAELSTGIKYVHTGRLPGELSQLDREGGDSDERGELLWAHEEQSFQSSTPSLLSRIPGLRVNQTPLLVSSSASPSFILPYLRPLDVILSLVSLDTGEVLWGGNGTTLASHSLPLAYCAAVSEDTVPGWDALGLCEVLRGLVSVRRNSNSPPRLALHCARPTKLIQMESCLRDLPINATICSPWPVEVYEDQQPFNHDTLALTSNFSFGGCLFSSGYGMGTEVGSGLDFPSTRLRTYVPTGSEFIELLLEPKEGISNSKSNALTAGLKEDGSEVAVEGTNVALDSEGTPYGCDFEGEDGTSHDPSFLWSSKHKRGKLSSAEGARAAEVFLSGDVSFLQRTGIASVHGKDEQIDSFCEVSPPLSRPASTLVFVRGKSGQRKSITGVPSRVASQEEVLSLEDYVNSFLPGTLSSLSPIPTSVNNLLTVALRAETRRIVALEAIQNQIGSSVVPLDETSTSQGIFTGDLFAFKPHCSDFTTLLEHWESDLVGKGDSLLKGEEKKGMNVSGFLSLCSRSALVNCNLQTLKRGSIQRILSCCGFPTSGEEETLLLMCRLYMLKVSPVLPLEVIGEIPGSSCSFQAQGKISFLAAADSLSTALAASSQTSFTVSNNSLWVLSNPFSGSIQEEAGILSGQYCYPDLLLASPTFLSSLSYSQIVVLSQGVLDAHIPESVPSVADTSAGTTLGPVIQGSEPTATSLSSSHHQQSHAFTDGAGKRKRKSGQFSSASGRYGNDSLGYPSSSHFSRGLGLTTASHYLRVDESNAFVNLGGMLSEEEVKAESTGTGDLIGRTLGSLSSLTWQSIPLHIPPSTSFHTSSEGYDASTQPPSLFSSHLDCLGDARKRTSFTQGESCYEGGAAPAKTSLPPFLSSTKTRYNVLPEGAAAMSLCEGVDWPADGKSERVARGLHSPTTSPIFILSALLGSCSAISLDSGKTTLLVSGRLPDPVPYLSRVLLDASLSSRSLFPASVFPIYPLALRGGSGVLGEMGYAVNMEGSEDGSPSLLPLESSLLSFSPFPSGGVASAGVSLGASPGTLPCELLARISSILAPEARRFARRSFRGSSSLLNQAHAFVSALSTSYSPQPLASDILADLSMGSCSDDLDDAVFTDPDIISTGFSTNPFVGSLPTSLPIQISSGQSRGVYTEGTTGEEKRSDIAFALGDKEGMAHESLKGIPPATSSSVLPPAMSLQPALLPAKGSATLASSVPGASSEGPLLVGGKLCVKSFEHPMVVPLYGLAPKDVSAADTRVLHSRSTPFSSFPSTQPFPLVAPLGSPPPFSSDAALGVASTPLSATTPCWGRSSALFAKSTEAAGLVTNHGNGEYGPAAPFSAVQDHTSPSAPLLPSQPPLSRATLLRSLLGEFSCVCQRVAASHVASLARRFPRIDKYIHSPSPFILVGPSIVGAVHLVRSAIMSECPPSTTIVCHPNLLPPLDFSSHYFNSALKSALAIGSGQTDFVLFSHSKVCTEAGRRRLGALIVEASAMGLHSLAITMASWIPSDIVPLEGGEYSRGGGGKLEFKPLHQWNLPAKIQDTAKCVGLAGTTIPYPRYVVEPFSSAVPISFGSGVGEVEAIPPRTSHCLVQYICEGSVSSPLGLRLYHPAAVLYLATRVLPIMEGGL